MVLGASHPSYATGTVGVLLRQGVGNGTIIGSASVFTKLPLFPTTTAVHLDFGSAIPVIPGQTYTIELLDPDRIFFEWGHGVGDTYLGGAGYVCLPTCFIFPYDYGFATYFAAPGGISLSPLDETNDVGTTHTVTANVIDDIT